MSERQENERVSERARATGGPGKNRLRLSRERPRGPLASRTCSKSSLRGGVVKKLGNLRPAAPSLRAAGWRWTWSGSRVPVRFSGRGAVLLGWGLLLSLPGQEGRTEPRASQLRFGARDLSLGDRLKFALRPSRGPTFAPKFALRPSPRVGLWRPASRIPRGSERRSDLRDLEGVLLCEP